MVRAKKQVSCYDLLLRLAGACFASHLDASTACVICECCGPSVSHVCFFVCFGGMGATAINEFIPSLQSDAHWCILRLQISSHNQPGYIGESVVLLTNDDASLLPRVNLSRDTLIGGFCVETTSGTLHTTLKDAPVAFDPGSAHDS